MRRRRQLRYPQTCALLAVILVLVSLLWTLATVTSFTFIYRDAFIVLMGGRVVFYTPDPGIRRDPKFEQLQFAMVGIEYPVAFLPTIAGGPGGRTTIAIPLWMLAAAVTGVLAGAASKQQQRDGRGRCGQAPGAALHCQECGSEITSADTPL